MQPKDSRRPAGEPTRGTPACERCRYQQVTYPAISNTGSHYDVRAELTSGIQVAASASMKTNQPHPNHVPRVRDVNRETLPPLDGDKPAVTVSTPLPPLDDGGEGVLSGQRRDLAATGRGRCRQEIRPIRSEGLSRRAEVAKGGERGVRRGL
jgi:hypothetical protein